jgi:hypothetical protein
VIIGEEGTFPLVSDQPEIGEGDETPEVDEPGRQPALAGRG